MMKEIEKLEALFKWKVVCCSFSIDAHYNGDIIPAHTLHLMDGLGLISKKDVLEILMRNQNSDTRSVAGEALRGLVRNRQVPDTTRVSVTMAELRVLATPVAGGLDVERLAKALHDDPALCRKRSPHGHPSWMQRPLCVSVAERALAASQPVAEAYVDHEKGLLGSDHPGPIQYPTDEPE